MVVGEAMINNIMGGIENTGSVRLHNHKRKLKQRFHIVKKLGQGTYGKVQLGVNKETGQEVAIKTIKKSKIETEADLIRIRREIQIMSSVQHPNIIHIYEVFENKEKIVIVMEFAAGGELYDYLFERKVLEEEEARRIFRQIATACYYCHKHKICHRDLKLENILLDDKGQAKIADFGLSNVFDDHRHLSTYCGSPLYASPEIVKGTPYHGPEVDCWSLGVLLYTLVYGAMPFDGSNFKRLVKSISQGEYFEPKNPSRASPLISEMLTVNPKKRADIEQICAHWWVNEGYEESCLDLSEELAVQTPVRLDVLLSLNAPPPQMEADNLVVPGDVPVEPPVGEAAAPVRSQSVGSLMELSNSAERRIQEMMTEESVPTPKRKLENTVSSEQANVLIDGKRKEKIVKEKTCADVTVAGGGVAENQNEKMDDVDPSLQGAACAEIIEEANLKSKKPVKAVKKTLSTSVNNKILEGINENPSLEETAKNDKENEIAAVVKEKPKTEETKEEVKATPKKKVVKKKVLTDKNEKNEAVVAKPKELEETVKKTTEEAKVQENETPIKVERRQSRIFEQAEKFQNMISSAAADKAPSPEKQKPKKIIIPGVSVGGFKKEFERKASLTNVAPPKLKNTTSKKLIIDQQKESIDMEAEISPPPMKAAEVPSTPISKTPPGEPKVALSAITAPASPVAAVPAVKEEEKPKEDKVAQLARAVSVISSAIEKEGARKSKSRPCMVRKPPVPFGASGRSASGSISMIASPLSPQSVKPFKIEPLQKPDEEPNDKSATLPRRKTTTAQIQLSYPQPKPAVMEFKTEMSHEVPAYVPQRTEISFPVQKEPPFRTKSVDAAAAVDKKREHIIPIAFEKRAEDVQSPKPPVPRVVPQQQQQQQKISSQRSSSLSRQSTNDSDAETVSTTGEPIKKSPREYIIPIAVEGGGYVTPRAGSLEPSESSSTVTSRLTSGSKFRTPRRMISSFFDRDGSEDESPFSSLHRHSSIGKDSDTEDSKKDIFGMHRLRSSRPKKAHVEHADSLSSGEDDDDDDGFQFLTAENLFSTLLARVRDLTQSINSDDGSRPGFPNSRFLSPFGARTNMLNRIDSLGASRSSPLGRPFGIERSLNNPSVPWRRSVSRDLASDIDSVFNNSSRMSSSTLPRTEQQQQQQVPQQNLNLSDLNLKKLKLTEEDALALSYLTPGLSRRIQKQLFASLPASEARKITRTLSMRTTGADGEGNDTGKIGTQLMPQRHSVDRMSMSCSAAYTAPLKDEGNASTNDARTLSQQSRILKFNKISNSSKEPDGSTAAKYRFGGGGDNKELTPVNETNAVVAPEKIPLSSYMHKRDDGKPARRISRFLRPDFFDPPKEDENVVVKEKKERERETQQVLKEIRDKRIKNRLSLRRERSLSKERLDANNTTQMQSAKIVDDANDKMVKCKDLVEALKKKLENSEIEIGKQNEGINSVVGTRGVEENKETEVLLNNVSDNIKNIETVLTTNSNNNESLKKVSKLVRPKSYPAENNVQNDIKEKSPETSKISRIAKFKRTPTTSPNKQKMEKPAGEKAAEKVEKTKNKFLQSIEKKFEKLRTFSHDDKNDKKVETEEKAGVVEGTIRRMLREQSEPKTTDHITESTLIKRAVSVEDFSNVKSKCLQPSRKSVTKILSLFKKYEDKKTAPTTDESVETAAAAATAGKLPEICESNIPTIKKFRDAKSPEGLQRPKSLFLEKVKKYNHGKNDSSASTERKSKLPVHASSSTTNTRKSLNLEPVINGSSSEDTSNNNNSAVAASTTTERKGLKLELKNPNVPCRENTPDRNLNRISYSTDDGSSTVFSPCDETLSDSWSICSDHHQNHNDLLSPLSPNGNSYSGDEGESVIDRIRRKSFYSRFNNEKKRPRKSLVGNYRDLDLYKDYNKSYKYKPTSGQYSSNSLKRNHYSSPVESGEEYKTYVRSKSAGVDYVNVPRYQTYNPRRHSNIASLYHDDLDDEPLMSTGTYRKYSYSPSTSRFGSLSRTSISPSGDFHYVPHANSSREKMSLSPPLDNGNSSSTSSNNNGLMEHTV